MHFCIKIFGSLVTQQHFTASIMRGYYFTDFVIDLCEFALKKYKYVVPGRGKKKRKSSSNRSDSKKSRKQSKIGTSGRSGKAAAGKGELVMIEGRFPFLLDLRSIELRKFVEMAAFIFFQSSLNKAIMAQIMELVAV